MWLALIYFFTDGSYNAVRWAQVVPGVMVIYLVYALTHRVLGPRAGLLAAFFSSISYILIHQSVRLLSESIYTPVILLAAIALWDAVQKPAVWRFA
jgi:4-amino-4-deoxy-L-arabinose transferase-like glycosyltransferase